MTGLKAGFSTLTISSGNVIATGTITVVALESGVSGYSITGLTQDRAGRLYLANTSKHTILLSQNIKSTPTLYPGVTETPGFKDAPRLEALFKEPASVALSQSTGVMYASDSENHVIRRIQPGPDGRVETFAGLGVAGSLDGTGETASFRNPQGVALDHRGYLWVVDSGNHTIRRISLVTKQVETIAGLAGTSGSSDGKGLEARFNSPMGISLETEPLAKQLEREAKGNPPPPISMIVADTGNGILRRVKEDGLVETVGSTPQPERLTRPSGTGSQTRSVLAPLSFTRPTGVVVDPVGDIYVSEPDRNRVRVVLPDGNVVPALQTGTVKSPMGITIGELGKVLVAGGGNSAQELRYGPPNVTSVTPDKIGIDGGEKITVIGSNFSTDTLVVLGSVLVSSVNILNTTKLTFVASKLGSGKTTLSIQNRAGAFQGVFIVEPPSLAQIPTGYITTVAGGSTYTGDGDSATAAELYGPVNPALDSAGNLFIADSENHRIRAVRGPADYLPCIYSASPTSRSHSYAFGVGGVGVTTSVGCGWTAKSDSTWVTVDAGATGTGNGTVNYSLTANTSTDSRIVNVTLAGQIVTVTQAGAPGVQITLGKSTYSNGDVLTATEFRIRNSSASSVQVRLRVYLKSPLGTQFDILDVGADGSWALPANLDFDLGPLTLFTISSTFPTKGNWELNSRTTDPTTGALISEDINKFVIQ